MKLKKQQWLSWIHIFKPLFHPHWMRIFLKRVKTDLYSVSRQSSFWFFSILNRSSSRVSSSISMVRRLELGCCHIHGGDYREPGAPACGPRPGEWPWLWRVALALGGEVALVLEQGRCATLGFGGLRWCGSDQPDLDALCNFVRHSGFWPVFAKPC